MIGSNRRIAAATLAALFSVPALFLAPARGQTPPPPPVYPIPQAPSAPQVPGAQLATNVPGSAGVPQPNGVSKPDASPMATGAPRTLPGMRHPKKVLPDQPFSGAGSRLRAVSSPQPPSISQPSPPSGPASGIAVASLGEIEGPPTGTLDRSNGGLGMDLWSHTPRAVAEELMARLPLATPVRPIHALARRIVLTKAVLPTGPATRAFMTVRVKRLLAAGLVNDAADLATVARIQNDPAFARVQADALLLAGRSPQICGDTTATRLNSSAPFWIELRAYCYAMAGDDAALSLTRAVMDAQNIDDEAFDTLLSDVRNKVAKDPGGIDAPNALHIYMMGQVGLPIDYDTGVQLGAPGLVLVARNPANAPEDRMKAAEQLLHTGAMSVDDLVLIADAQHFTQKQFANEHAQLQNLSFLAGQALLRQAARNAAPAAQPALIFEALRDADMKGQLSIAAVLQQSALEDLMPAPNLRGMAPLFMRALMLDGHPGKAARWLALIDVMKRPDRSTVAWFDALLALHDPAPQRLAAAQLSLGELANEVTGRTAYAPRAALMLSLYSALGHTLPPPVQVAANMAMQTRWAGRRPATATLRRLNAARAAPARRGEALMLVLNAIGSAGPADLAPDVTAGLVRDAVQLGVPDAAQSIAISALLNFRAAPWPVHAVIPPAPRPK